MANKPQYYKRLAVKIAIIAVPSFGVAVITAEMVYTIPMLATSTFLASHLFPASLQDLSRGDGAGHHRWVDDDLAHDSMEADGMEGGEMEGGEMEADEMEADGMDDDGLLPDTYGG